MDALLANQTLCKTIYRALPAITEVLMRIQLDITDETNRDTVGPTILALKHNHDAFTLIATKGAVYAKAEEKQTKP